MNNKVYFIIFIILFSFLVYENLFFKNNESNKLSIEKNSASESNVSLNSFCEDNTLINQCSKTRPYFCKEGVLIEDCRTCGCDNNYFCNNKTCTSCKESWVCSEWSDCVNSKQRKGCFDLNDCGTKLNKPIDERKC